MSTTVAQLVAQVTVQGASEAKTQLKGVDDAVKKTSGHAKSALSGFLSFASAQLVVNALGQAAGFLKDQIGSVFQETMQAQQSMAQTVAVLHSTHDASGETAQSIADLAGNLSHLTLFSDDTTQAAENMLLTFTNIGKNVFPQATKTVLDMSQALGQDTKSSAIQLGKALNDPITGVSALQRVGVTFTDSQKNLIKSLVDSGNTAGAQKIILQELQREFGGSAEAAGKTFPGQLQILGQSLDDIKQNIGNALMPVMQSLIGQVSSQVVPAFSRFSDWMKTTGVPAIQKFASFVHDNAMPILAGLAAFVIGIVVPAFWSWAAAMIANPIGLIITGIALVIAGLSAAFVHFYTTNAGFKSFIDGIGNALKQAGAWIQANFLPVLKQIGDWIKAYVMPFLQQIGTFIAGQFMPVWKQLTQLWQGTLMPLFAQLGNALKQMTPLFQLLGMIIGGLVLVAIGNIVGIISGLAKGIGYLVEGLAYAIGGIVQFFTGVAQFIGGIVQFIVDLFTGHFDKLAGDLGGIWTGIKNMFMGILNTIAGLFSGAWGLISGFIGGFVQGVIGFFTTLWDELVGHSIVPDMLNAILGFFTSIPAKILGGIQAFVGMLIGHFNMLKAEAIAIFVSIVDGIGGAMGKLAGLAGSAWNGMLGAIRSGINGIIGLINNFIDGIDRLHINLPGGGSVGFSIPDIPYLATGGLIGAAGMATVGERGPEQVWLPRGAQVIPNSGGTPGQQPIVVQPAPVYLDGRQLMNGLMPYFANAVRYGTGTKF